MDVSEAIRYKRAVREFQPRPLKPEEMRAILEAGRRAQSSKNTQPWTFLAITRRETLQALSKSGRYAGHLAGAAFAVAILTPDPAEKWSILFDAGQAAAYMQLAAWELGIGSVLAAVHYPDVAREALGYPPDLHLHAVISFGYPADESLLRARPRAGGRRPLDELVRWETY
ncbi:MAG TPA: nitroreductase [Chloroflexi bacterium]|jgi:nitroreductase|nr:nitroreductase [Chloroflexota bacterium]HPO58660.1 nitroreductase family protein [Anaerolineaceae bacterium]